MWRFVYSRECSEVRCNERRAGDAADAGDGSWSSHAMLAEAIGDLMEWIESSERH